MYDCVRRGKINEWDTRCKARTIESSHGGGTDFSAPCKQNVNEKGKHKGNHVTEQGFEWKPGPNDRWID